LSTYYIARTTKIHLSSLSFLADNVMKRRRRV